MFSSSILSKFHPVNQLQPFNSVQARTHHPKSAREVRGERLCFLVPGLDFHILVCASNVRDLIERVIYICYRRIEEMDRNVDYPSRKRRFAVYNSPSTRYNPPICIQNSVDEITQISPVVSPFPSANWWEREGGD